MDSVRAVRAEDRDRCTELLTEAIAEASSSAWRRPVRGAGTPGGTGVPSRGPEDLVAEWSGGDDRLALVGEFAGVPVGIAAGSIRRGDRTVGEVRCCYVEPGARGVGVGGVATRC